MAKSDKFSPGDVVRSGGATHMVKESLKGVILTTANQLLDAGEVERVYAGMSASQILTRLQADAEEIPDEVSGAYVDQRPVASVYEATLRYVQQHLEAANL